MMMMMAQKTSALDRVEAERHQADEPQRAYSSFGESLHQKKEKEMKHIAWSEKKNVAHSHLSKEKGKPCSHAILNMGEE